MDYYEPTAAQWERDLRDLRRRLLKALGFILLVTAAGVVGFSIITDLCYPDALEPANVEEIIGHANSAEPKLTMLVTKLLAREAGKPAHSG